MPKSRRFALFFVMVALAFGAGQVLADCSIVRVPYVGISTDSGASFLPFRGRPPVTYSLTYGLAATARPGLVYMHAADTFWVSENDGCTWTRFGPGTSGLIRIASGGGEVAYAWPVNGGATAYRLGASAKVREGFAADPVGVPESSLQGFAVDPADDSHLRAVGRLGQIHESRDGGATWSALGVPASPGGTVIPYFGAFDPRDLDHVLYGQATDGGYVTFDGGNSWEKSSGLSAGRANFFNAMISPVDGNVVYGMALDLEENLAGAPSEGRHIYRSIDGGLTFTPVLDHGTDGVFLQNAPLMAADPSRAALLHFVFSVRPAFGGTTFYRYDGSSGTLQLTANPAIPVVRSMAFSTADPARMFAGFEIVP